MHTKKNTAFSLVEISVVIIILMVMIAGLVQSSRLIAASRLTSARNLTSSSAMPWINYIIAWHDTTSIEAFTEEENNNGKKISSWSGAEIRTNDRVSLIQDDDSKRPTLINNALYGLPALKFDGIDDYLISKNTEQDVLSYRSGSIFIVFEPRDVVSNKKNTIFHNQSDCGLELDIGHTFASKGDFGISSGSGNCGSIAATTTSFDFAVLNERMIASIIIYQSPTSSGATSNVKIFRNGFPKTVSATNNGYNSSQINSTSLYSTGLHNFVYGARKANPSANPESFFNGLLGEIIVFSRSVNNEDRRDIEKYLGKKWGIKVNYGE